jgi:hypothetical protein
MQWVLSGSTYLCEEVLFALQHTQHGLLCCVHALQVPTPTKPACSMAVTGYKEGKMYSTKPPQQYRAEQLTVQNSLPFLRQSEDAHWACSTTQQPGIFKHG